MSCISNVVVQFFFVMFSAREEVVSEDVYDLIACTFYCTIFVKKRESVTSSKRNDEVEVIKSIFCYLSTWA